ncbi:MAG: DUF1232 domain-containing protein [Chloroflexota bacterium]
MSDNSLLPYDDLGIESLNQTQIEQRAPDWYESWRGRIQSWLVTHSDDEAAAVILFVPDLLALVIRLARDKRVPFMLKGQLLLAAAYVISPIDLIPEAFVGVVGLGDDAGVLMLVLMWIKGIASLDRQVLHENWSGQGDVIEVIEGLHTRINASADRLYGKNIWHTLQRRFSRVRRLFPRWRIGK